MEGIGPRPRFNSTYKQQHRPQPLSNLIFQYGALDAFSRKLQGFNMMKHCNICVVSTRVSHSQLESQALTDAGDASKFDCLEFRDASGGGQGQSNKCYWYLEQPDKATALPFLRIRSVSSGYYLHVRRSWQTLAGNFGSRGKCLMLHRRAGPAGGGVFHQ